MSGSSEIAYRRLVASFARNLCAQDVYTIAYVRLTGKEDVSKFSSSKIPNASGLDLMATLERCGIFSIDHIDGLVDVANDINRRDLVKMVKEYKKNLPRHAKSKSGRQTIVRTQDEERKHLEEAFEQMATKLMVLEQHLQLLRRTFSEETVLRDEAVELLHNGGKIVQEMATNLQRAHDEISSRPRTNSWSSSGSSGTGSSSDSPASTPGDSNPPKLLQSGNLHQTSLQQSVARNASKETNAPIIYENLSGLSLSHQKEMIQKPLPKPRRYSKLYRPEETIATGTARDISQLCDRCEDSVEDADLTGDSGIGESGYSSIETWRQAIKYSPPDTSRSSKHDYMSLKQGNRDKDSHYERLQLMKTNN